MRPALVNAAAGAVVATRKRVLSVMAFTVTGGKIAQIDVLDGPGAARRPRLDAARHMTIVKPLSSPGRISASAGCSTAAPPPGAQ